MSGHDDCTMMNFDLLCVGVYNMYTHTHLQSIGYLVFIIYPCGCVDSTPLILKQLLLGIVSNLLPYLDDSTLYTLKLCR